MEQTPVEAYASMSDIPDDDIENALTEQAETALTYTDARATRFYDRIRGRIQGFVGSRGGALGKTADFLLLVPDVFILLWRLLGDSRVAGKDKILVGSAVAYFISPIDLIPEAFFGPIGYLDDLIFGVYVLNRLLTTVDVSVLREHWSGSADVLQTIRRVMNAADDLVSKEVLGKLKKMAK
jgi:uncharacterized membrane protein YkvA (DUF1232 family)